MPSTPDSKGQWIDPGDLEGEVRLFCFAHAGGSAGFFHPWRRRLAPAIAVTPVVMPGRDARWREAPYVRMDALLEPLCEAVRVAIDRPFAFFGHSLGAVVAFEVATRLAEQAERRPRCLLVSGRRAPHLPSRRPPIHDLPTERFLAELKRLNGTADALFRDPELLHAMLPRLRADFELHDTYAPRAPAPLPVPISAFVGDRDPLVEVDEVRRWGELTTTDFGLRVYAGDHFYLAGVHDRLLEAIEHEVERSERGGDRSWPS